ncbi:unnamed protein product [Arctia plantaginis]|uniref:Defensin n=1 Tax=Arctia plantaginis TaxID=874455 RepID=A0A8S1BEH9_ARCPL|nr:unnamed protein product [Arctia plantaginis]
MKFLAVAFAIVLVVQLADVAADKLPFNDLTETHGQQLNLDNSNVRTARLTIPIQRCNITKCGAQCRSRGFVRGICIATGLCRCTN